MLQLLKLSHNPWMFCFVLCFHFFPSPVVWRCELALFKLSFSNRYQGLSIPLRSLIQSSLLILGFLKYFSLKSLCLEVHSAIIHCYYTGSLLWWWYGMERGRVGLWLWPVTFTDYFFLYNPPDPAPTLGKTGKLVRRMSFQHGSGTRLW